MIRAWFLLAIIAGWLLFLQLEKKDRLDYLAGSLSVASSDQLMDWNSDNLFFEGWSTAEATHRWSITKQPMICFKLLPEPEFSHLSISITIDADAVEPLVDRLIHVQINDRIVEYRMTADHRHIFKFNNVRPSKNNVFCLRFELPVTANAVGDPRDLGLSFKGLLYSYLNNRTNGKAK